MKFLIAGNRELIRPDFFRVNLVPNLSMAVQICLSDRDSYWRIVSYGSPFTIDIYRFSVSDWENIEWQEKRTLEETQEDERTKCRIRFFPETDEEAWFVSTNKGIPNASSGNYWRQEKDEITFLFLAWSLISRKSLTGVSFEYEDVAPFGFA